MRTVEEQAAADLMDLLARSSDDLYAASYAHRRAACVRKTAAALVRIYNPTLDEDGWRSTHSIVDIVVDNIPFVDSVLAAMTHRDTAEGMHTVLHRVASPVVLAQRSVALREFRNLSQRAER